MTDHPPSDHLLGILRETIIALVRRDSADLTARQLSVFLTTYLHDDEHTVRGLAADLNVSKPAITRALDRLETFDLARRVVDQMDRRSVLVRRTPAGSALLHDLRDILTNAAAAPEMIPPAAARKSVRSGAAAAPSRASHRA